MARRPKSQSPLRIREINQGLLDENSAFYINIEQGPRVRFESIIDLALMNLTEDVVRIFDKRPNLLSALDIIDNAIAEKNDKPVYRSLDSVEVVRKRISSCKSFNQAGELGLKKCPPPKGGRAAADWWTWQLNQYYNNVYGYAVKAQGIINNEFIVAPSYQDLDVIAFDRPLRYKGLQVNFKVQFILSDVTSKDEIVLVAPLAFAD